MFRDRLGCSELREGGTSGRTSRRRRRTTRGRRYFSRGASGHKNSRCDSDCETLANHAPSTHAYGRRFHPAARQNTRRDTERRTSRAIHGGSEPCTALREKPFVRADREGGRECRSRSVRVRGMGGRRGRCLESAVVRGLVSAIVALMPLVRQACSADGSPIPAVVRIPVRRYPPQRRTALFSRISGAVRGCRRGDQRRPDPGGHVNLGSVGGRPSRTDCLAGAGRSGCG